MRKAERSVSKQGHLQVLQHMTVKWPIPNHILYLTQNHVRPLDLPLVLAILNINLFLFPEILKW